MDTIISGLRDVIGTPAFYNGSAVDYGAVCEYFVASLVLLVVVSSVFKILVRWFEK